MERILLAQYEDCNCEVYLWYEKERGIKQYSVIHYISDEESGGRQSLDLDEVFEFVNELRGIKVPKYNVGDIAYHISNASIKRVKLGKIVIDEKGIKYCGKHHDDQYGENSIYPSFAEAKQALMDRVMALEEGK